MVRHLEHLATQRIVLKQLGVDQLPAVAGALQFGELVGNLGPGVELGVAAEYQTVLLEPLLL
jgi:hypothetical protein